MMQTSKVYDQILSYTVTRDRNNYLLAPKTVYDFFAFGNAIRKIPDYQRPYSWSNKNISALLEDILKISKDESASWFLGPVFTTKHTNDDEVSQLLDGQQRITTIQIVLREAALVKLKFEDFNWSKFPELKGKIDRIVEACVYSLIKVDIQGSQSRFKTEESIADLFEKYILDIKKVNTNEEALRNKKKFGELLDLEKNQGSKTAGRISSSIKFVNKFIDDEILKKSIDNQENLENFCSFMDALLIRCWFIEIPLKEDDNSIQIFESLNNRGKKLSLLDKLRYKSLINCSDSIRENIKKQWKKIYLGLENMDEWGYVKNEDDFFKVLFNSICGHDYTDESDFIELYEEAYLTSDSKIEAFLVEVRKVIQFYEYIQKALDLDNEFIKRNFDNNNKKRKVRALLQVLKNGLAISDNSRFLLFHLIRKNDLFSESDKIVEGIWTIIRMIYFEEIFENTKSNKIRVDFLKKIELIETGKLRYSQIINRDNLNYKVEGKSIINAIRTTDSREAKFIIYLYNYLTDYESLIAAAPDQVEKSELDHFFPRAWKTYWSDKQYKKEDLIISIKSLDSKKFQKMNLPLLVSELQTLEEVELKDYNTTYYKQVNSIIEFIGNKWVLHSGSNIKTGNKGLDRKRDIYANSKYIKIPANQNKLVGLDKYSEFGQKQIIERSLEILNGISENFYLNWDEID